MPPISIPSQPFWRRFQSIEACLAHWTQEETLSGDNAVFCDACQERTETKLWHVSPRGGGARLDRLARMRIGTSLDLAVNF